MAAPAVLPRHESSPTSGILENVLHLAGGQAAATGAALIWLYFVPRTIGPGGMGMIAIASSVTALLGTLLNSGIGTLLTRDIARRPERSNALVGAGLIVRIVSVLPAAAFIVLYIRLLHVGPLQEALIWLAAAAMLISAASGIIQAAFLGLEQMRFLAYANAIGNALNRFAGIAVVMAGLGVIAIMQANLVLTGLVLLLNLLWMRGRFVPDLRPRPRELRYVMTRSATFWGGGVIFTAYLWIDTVILSTLAPVDVVGWYNTPTQIFAALLTAASVVGTAWFPRFARAFTEGTASLRAVARPALEMIVLLSLPVSAGLAAVAHPLILSLYGPAFDGAVPVLVVLAITMLPTFFNMVAYQVLLASDRQTAWIRVVIVAVVVNVVLNVVLIRWFQAHQGNGAFGAALSLLITEIFQSCCAFALVPRVFDSPFLRRIARGVAATAMMTGLVLLTAHYAPPNRLGLAAQVTVGLVSFAVLCLVLRLPSESEAAQLRAMWARVRG
jgi:O-antigen/teichoic acid export membrane protein